MTVDYYEILQISPTATLAEIKTAYRRLAHLYHPDKNPGNKRAQAHFELIKEAYEILSNPANKEQYLQDRWLAKAQGNPFQNAIITPENILTEVLDTSTRLSYIDQYRMNKEGVKTELLELLSDINITILQEHNEISINDAIVSEFLRIINILPAVDELALLERVRLIPSNHTETLKKRENTLQSNMFWENWKPAFILLMVILLCLLIWSNAIR